MGLRLLLLGTTFCCLLFMIFSQDVLPFLETVPNTAFTCSQRIYGYYADVEANCQSFHVCHNNRKWSFLCPNQTMFNQELLVCDWPENVLCGNAETYYSVNENFGKVDTSTRRK